MIFVTPVLDTGVQVIGAVAQRHKSLLSVLTHRTLFTWIPGSSHGMTSKENTGPQVSKLVAQRHIPRVTP